MDHFQQTVAIDAAPSAVYAALTTAEGLRGWWTPECTVDTHVGGVIHLHFGQTRKDMCIEQLDTNRGVRWFCTRASIASEDLTHKDEWVGTEIAFRLTPTFDGKTRLDFGHVGLVPSLECYAMCERGWRYFLGSLKQLAETGHGMSWAMSCAA